jgi:hypothetical protein
MVIYKRDRITIGDEANRYEYKLAVPWCECCGKVAGSSVHHHIPQSFRHLGDVYIIDLPINYSTLGVWCGCHAIVEHNEKQYYGKGLDVKSGKSWDYWHKLKDGQDADEFIANWLKEQEA